MAEETWLTIAVDNRRAAAELCEPTRYRSCVNRAYYAVYSRAAHALICAGVTMPKDEAGRRLEGPRHRPLTRDLIENGLKNEMDTGKCKTLQRLVAKIYNLRVMADYRHSVAVEAADARLAISVMNKAFNLFP